MGFPTAILLVLLAAGTQEQRGFQASLFDELVELFPDSDAGAGSRERALDTARGVPAGVHVLVTGLDPDAELRLGALEGEQELASARWFRLIDVPVEENTGLRSRTEVFDGTENPHVIRRAPFRVFEALAPVGSTFVPEAATVALRLEMPVIPDARTGRRTLRVRLEQTDTRRELAWTVTVHAALVPPPGRDTLVYTNWFSPNVIAEQHAVELWSEAFWAMLSRYAELMARGRQNTFWVRWTDHFEDLDGDGLAELDRARLERYVRTFREAGLYWLEGAPVASRPEGDWSKDWLLLRIADVPATGREGRRALAHMGKQLDRVLIENGWRDAWLQHVADEPTDVNAEDYVKLAGLVREALPGVPIVEATMSREVVGGIDVWCPQVHEYQRQREFFEERRAAGERVWVYTCLVPGGPWINRLLDQERLRPVWIGWAAQRFGIEGFLHWGLNHYKSDPFEHSVVDHPAMPNTTNKLPAGDTHVVFPGPDGPWSGQRFEAHRIGLEDRELLLALETRDPEAADELIQAVFRGFDDYEKDVEVYRATKRRLLSLLDGH